MFSGTPPAKLKMEGESDDWEGWWETMVSHETKPARPDTLNSPSSPKPTRLIGAVLELSPVELAAIFVRVQIVKRREIRLIKMTTLKFLQDDEALAAIIRALATKVAGHGIVSGMTDEVLKRNGYYEFPFDYFQEQQFKSYLTGYLRDEHRTTLELTSDCKDPFAEFAIKILSLAPPRK